MNLAPLWLLSGAVAVLTILHGTECAAMYEMPSAGSVPQDSSAASASASLSSTLGVGADAHQSDSLQSSSDLTLASQPAPFARNIANLSPNRFYYSRALRNAFGKLFAVPRAVELAAARDDDGTNGARDNFLDEQELDIDSHPFGRQQQVFTRPANVLLKLPLRARNANEKRAKPSLSISNSLDVLRQQVMLDFARRQMRENIKQIEMNRAHLNSIGKRAGGYSKTAADTLIERLTRADPSGNIDSSNDAEFYQRLAFQHQMPTTQLQPGRQVNNYELFGDLAE